MTEPVLQVALPLPLPGLFDYRVPETPGPAALPGCRVRVPFGNRELVGVIFALAGEAAVPAGRLKPAGEVLDDAPLLTGPDLAFLGWCAAYYHHPLGEVVSAALPARIRKGGTVPAAGERAWRVTQAGTEAGDELRRAPRQAGLLRLLADAGGIMADSQLRQVFEGASKPLRALQDKGLVTSCELQRPALSPVRPSIDLNPEQAAAVEAVANGGDGFGVTLLEGVTGSGKTEVYLRLAAHALDRGCSVLVLVPEISLTPQLLGRFVARFGPTVVMLHSGLADGERDLAWEQVRGGYRRILLGTRSSVFAPMPDLGLVVVDEEHDTSYKQQDGFRYSARDLAVVRGRRAACPVVLGSATPSLESLRNAEAGRYAHLHLLQRAGGAQPPTFHLLDVRGEVLHAGLSPRLIREVSSTLAREEQALLFINRRGYAPVLCCYACGWLSDCPHCDARQTLHRGAGALVCHHCGHRRPQPQRCPDCGAAELHPLGQGTERLDEYLREHFPGVPLLRIDRDTTTRRDSLERKLDEVREAGAALLVGTQMLAKGHHFPRVTLVGIVDVDGGLFSADFRAAERMAQLVVQVAGRAGREERRGQVILQTRYPGHPMLRTLVTRGYPGFAREALAERRLVEMPPFSHQALLRADARQAKHPDAFLGEVVEWLNGHTAEPVEVWGPVPAPMQRRAGMFRAQLLLQAVERDALHRILGRLDKVLPGLESARRVRWSLDVDPVDLY